MRFVCRACRQEVDEKSVSCGNCDAVLDSRSRIALSEVGLDEVTAPPPERAVAAPPLDRPSDVPDEQLSAGIISGSDKSAAGKPGPATVVGRGHTAALRPSSGSGAGSAVGPGSGMGSGSTVGQGSADGSGSTDGQRSAPPSRPGAGQKRKRPRKPARRTRRPGRPYGGVAPDAPSKVDDPPEPVPPPTQTKSTPGGRGSSGPPPLSGAPRSGPAETGSLGSPPGTAQPVGPLCQSCGTPNDPGNHFCDSCRQPMKAAQLTQLAKQQVGRDPWYRRAIGTTRFRGADNRLWGQRLRDRDLGSGLRHKSGMAARSRLKLAAVALAVVAVLALLLGPLRRPIAEVFSPPSDRVPFRVTIGGGAPEIPPESWDRLTDGSTQVGLEMPWETIPPPHVCSDQRPYAIRLDFAESQLPKELRIYVSKDPVDDGESPKLWPGPSLLSIQGVADCSVLLEVTTEAGWVSYDVEQLAGSGTWLELYIHDRREDPAVSANPVVVIGEIELLE